MFYYISGTLSYKNDSFAVIDCGGVGYKIYSTLPSLAAAGEVGAQAKMYTYLRMGEDFMDLYGFSSQEELNMFQMLIGVSGVGAKVGIAILSTVSPTKFAMSVVTNDAAAIKAAPGVGPKLAQRIILELKDKFKGLDFSDMQASEAFIPESGSDGEAVSALMVLGYSAQEAKRAVSGTDTSLGLEEVIKTALKKLMRG